MRFTSCPYCKRCVPSEHVNVFVDGYDIQRPRVSVHVRDPFSDVLDICEGSEKIIFRRKYFKEGSISNETLQS